MFIVTTGRIIISARLRGTIDRAYITGFDGAQENGDVGMISFIKGLSVIKSDGVRAWYHGLEFTTQAKLVAVIGFLLTTILYNITKWQFFIIGSFFFCLIYFFTFLKTSLRDFKKWTKRIGNEITKAGDTTKRSLDEIKDTFWSK